MDRLTYEEAIRNVLQNPQLSKAAIRLYLMLVMTKGESIQYLAPDILQLIDASDAEARRARRQLEKQGLIQRTGKGKVALKIIVTQPLTCERQEREIQCGS